MNKETEKEFIEAVVKEYTNNKIISEELCNVKYVKETDGSFIQIGLRQLIEEEIFDLKNLVSMLHLGMGRSIAIGEIKFFVEKINEEIASENEYLISLDDLSQIKEKINKLNPNFARVVIIVTPQVKYHLNMFELINYYYEDGLLKEFIKGSGMQIVTVNSSLLDNSLIVYERDKLESIYKKVDKNDLFIDINRVKEGYDVVVRSIMKVNISPHTMIKFKLTSTHKKPELNNTLF
ncbi:MAG: hypothetical protein AABX31_05780 [Nanoarchaeota archaeon]